MVAPSFACASVVTRSSGAGVVAGLSERRVAVAVRDPGGAWTPAELSLKPDEFAADVRVAASDRGDVLVVWRESVRLTVGAPRRRVLAAMAPLRLPVRCSRPCELRGEIRAGPDTFAGQVALRRGGRGELRIDGAERALSAPRARVRIRLAYRAPGGLDARTRTVAVTLRRPTAAPDMRVRELRAVRRGGTIRVTWRTAGRSFDGALFFVTGTIRRDRAEETGVARIVEGSDDRRSYSVTLRWPAGVRWVAVRSEASLITGRPAFARVH